VVNEMPGEKDKRDYGQARDNTDDQTKDKG
jgi:hypothetical protein